MGVIKIKEIIRIDAIEEFYYEGQVYSLKIENDPSYCLEGMVVTKNCDLPDIDMDFEDHKRHLVKKYLQDKYGEFNVAGLSTFMTMKGRGVITDVSRVYDIPLAEVKVATKAVDSTVSENQVKEAFETSPECMRFKKKYPEVVEVAEGLEGQIRGVGQHAAAVCVSSVDLREGLNCNLAIRSGQVVANWDKDNAEYMGLIKLDILGLSALSILQSAKEMIQKNHGVDIDFNTIPLDDKKVYREINKGNTVGAFQIGARGLSKFCQQLGVDDFGLLVAATALYRPGPLHSGMAEKFIKIKNGDAPVKKLEGGYDRITEDTFGIIVYQEQVMAIINQMSGIDMATCDKIRKLMAKSKGEEAINKYKQQFLDGCGVNGSCDKRLGNLIWKTILTFGKYGFNKAHSVEYSLITMWDMWLKTYYPGEFIAATLTHGGKDKCPEYLKEAGRLGLEVRLPKIGISHSTDWRIDTDRNLFAPFSAVGGIGEATAEAIAKYNPAAQKQHGFFLAAKQVSGKIPGVNKTVIEKLEKMGSFEPVGEISRAERALVKELLV